jgi:hypothetical protein
MVFVHQLPTAPSGVEQHQNHDRFVLLAYCPEMTHAKRLPTSMLSPAGRGRLEAYIRPCLRRQRWFRQRWWQA